MPWEIGLKDFGLVDGSILDCYDFLQDCNVKVYLWHVDKMENGQDFLMTMVKDDYYLQVWNQEH